MSKFTVIHFIAILWLLGGCTKQPNNPASDPPKWLRWTIAQEPGHFQWAKCETPRCDQFVSLLMEGLSRQVTEEGSPKSVLALAEDWKVLSPLEVKVTLKKDVRWNDGAVLEAKHFIDAWRSALSQCKQFPAAKVLFPISGAEAFCQGRISFAEVGVKALGADTLFLKLAAPYPDFQFQFSHPITWPLRLVKGKPSSPPITLGAFQIEKTSKTHWRFARSPSYYGEPPKIGGIEARLVSQGGTRLQMFLEGETDLVDEIPDALASQLLGNPSLHAEPTLSMTVLTLNPARRPFHQEQVRKAFVQAIDRVEHLELMKWPHFPATRLLAYPARRDGRDPNFSKAKATQILADLKMDLPGLRSFENGFYKPFPRPTLARHQVVDGEEIAQNLEAQWIKNLTLKVEPSPKGSPPPTAAMALQSFRPDPYERLRHLSQFMTLTAEPNVRPPTQSLDHWLNKAQNARTSETLQQALLGADELLTQQASLVVPLFFRARLVLRRPNVTLAQEPIEMWDFKSASIE